MKVVARNRFIAYEPGRFVAFEIPSGKMTGVASYRVEPTGADTCRLISAVDFQVAGLNPRRLRRVMSGVFKVSGSISVVLPGLSGGW